MHAPVFSYTCWTGPFGNVFLYFYRLSGQDLFVFLQVLITAVQIHRVYRRYHLSEPGFNPGSNFLYFNNSKLAHFIVLFFSNFIGQTKGSSPHSFHVSTLGTFIACNSLCVTVQLIENFDKKSYNIVHECANAQSRAIYRIDRRSSQIRFPTLKCVCLKQYAYNMQTGNGTVCWSLTAVTFTHQKW